MLLASLLGDAKILLPDSMLTLKKANTVANTDTLLTIIQTMRERKLAPMWQLDVVEGDYYFSSMSYKQSLSFYKRALESPETKDCEGRMKIYKRLMDVYDILFNDVELVNCMYQLRKNAELCHDDAHLAMVNFMKGKRMHYHRKQAEGYKLCLEAVDLMKSTDYSNKQTELCYFYAELLQMYEEDGRYEDALRMSLLQEETARSINVTNIKNRQTLRYIFALRASLLAKAGRPEEADLAYARWKIAAGGNCLIDKAILDYLILNNHYQDAHNIIHEYCDLLRSQDYNYSYRMVVMLTTAAQVENALGNYDEAARHCQEIRVIADSMHVRASQEQMRAGADLIQKDQDVKEKSGLVVVLAIILVVGLILGAIVLYYTRIIRHRNKALFVVLNSLDAYRNLVNVEQTEESEVPAVQKEPDIQPQQPEADDNERLFVKLDGRITHDKLFLNPNFGRDDMARLLGVDKNRIGNIMAKYSNASNASVYINTKRVEYGAKLLLKYPDYTIAAIATECGMSNTVTFNRTFKEVFGMTPSEYRAKMSKITK